MDATEEHARQLSQLLADTPCQRDHECLKLLPEKRCKARLGAGGKVLFCLEKNAQECGYGTTFGHGRLCVCAVRKYIAEHRHA